MTDGDPRDQIEQLEIEIEELAETAERCRKIILLSKVAMAAGGLLILAVVLAPIRFGPAALIGGIAAVIGGIVVLGSNKSTIAQVAIAMKSAETLRDELINRIALRVIERQTIAGLPDRMIDPPP